VGVQSDGGPGRKGRGGKRKKMLSKDIGGTGKLAYKRTREGRRQRLWGVERKARGSRTVFCGRGGPA